MPGTPSSPASPPRWRGCPPSWRQGGLLPWAALLLPSVSDSEPLAPRTDSFQSQPKVSFWRRSALRFHFSILVWEAPWARGVVWPPSSGCWRSTRGSPARGEAWPTAGVLLGTRWEVFSSLAPWLSSSTSGEGLALWRSTLQFF